MADGLFSSGGGNGQAAASLARGLFGGMAEQRKTAREQEEKRRAALIKQFDDIYDNKAGDWDEETRFKAIQYANQLRQVLYEPKAPKEFVPDKEGRVPALVDVTYRKMLKNGPGTPAEPPVPADPDAAAGGAMPNFDQMVTASGAPSVPSAPQPGGQHVGPNQITPGPAIPEMPPQPAMLSLEEKAQRARTDSDIRTSIDPELAETLGLPADIPMNAQTASLLKGSADRKTKLLLKGLDENGEPLPPEKLPPEIAMKASHLRAQEELWEAQMEYNNARDEWQRQAAFGRLQVAQQNANTAASRAALDASLYGGMLGGGQTGGAQGLFGQPGNTTDPVESFAEQVLSNQLEITAVPSKLRPLVSMHIANSGGIIIPKPLQTKLMQFTEAREAVDTIYDSIEAYQQARGVNKVWAAHKTSSTVSALTRLVGRSLGEKGVFTDADKADFTRLLSPGTVLTLTSPDRAQAWVKQVEALMNRVESEQLQGFYQRVYAKRDGTLSTIQPGSRKNVVAELGGDDAPPPPPPAPAPLVSAGASGTSDAIPPLEKRVAGVTKATINGVLRVWDGSAWVKVKP
jgi:hypothetical protein